VKYYPAIMKSLFILLSAALVLTGCGFIRKTAAPGTERATAEISPAATATETAASPSATEGTANPPNGNVSAQTGDKPSGTPTPEPAPTPAGVADADGAASASPGPEISRITLAAIGDVLIHSSIWKDATAGGTIDFRPMFRQVKPILQKADIAFANQESMMGGAGIGLSDYPLFNSPFEIGDALKDAGIDIVSMANNHSMDKREIGIRKAIERLNAIGIQYVGANSSEEDRQRDRIITKNGIKVAFLAYTFGTNGIPVPPDKPYLVNVLDKERIAADIRKVRNAADIVAVSMHFGTEYERTPNAEQKEWAQAAADAGADIILGHHPHVLQPVEWITSSQGRKTLVFYSLGNFLAAQEQTDPYRQLGGVAEVDFVKHKMENGTVTRPENVRFVPTYISFRNWRHYEVLPLDRVTDQMLPKVAIYRKEIERSMSQWESLLAFEYPQSK
jgi:poly-gamma-glutamate synthesis protein (capsule biosynthesis protein)